MPSAILILLIFVGVGIDTIIHPKRHMNSYLRSGGDMRRELNETGIQPEILQGFLSFVSQNIAA